MTQVDVGEQSELLRLPLSNSTHRNCSECPLNDPDRTPVRGEFGRNTKLIFVSRSPNFTDERTDSPFRDASGKLLRAVLEEANVKADDVGFTYLCLCRPPHGRDPTAHEISCCLPGLIEDINTFQSPIIVSLGGVPLNHLFPKQRKGIAARRGIIADTSLGCKGLATYEPFYVLNNETAFPEFQDDIVLAIEQVGAAQDDTRNIFTTKDTLVYVPKTIFDARDAAKMLFNLGAGTPLAYDWETTALSPRDGKGFCLGVAYPNNQSIVFPMWAIEGAYDELVQLFNSTHLTIGAFNSIFDATWNEAYGLNPRMDFDPMLMHYMLDERPQQRSLERLTMRYFRADPYESNMLLKYSATKANMTELIPESVIYHYCGMDTDYTLRLWLYLRDKLTQFPKVWHCYKELVMPAAQVFRRIRERGVLVDQTKLTALTEEYEAKVTALHKELEEITGVEGFNPRSPVQVGKYLWDVLQLEQPNFYGRSDRSVDKATREALLNTYENEPVLIKLTEYSAAYTMLSRYIRGIATHIHSDGRVRAEYHFDRSETGRLSTTNPAIHQIPRDSTIRTVFVARPGYVLVQADYAQIEMRFAAHIADDDTLSDILLAEDFHRKMAAEAYHIPYETVTATQRQAAKTVSFGLLYGMGERSLARKTGLPADEAHSFITRYKEITNNVQRWIAFIKQQVRNAGVVESVFGRRRRFYVLTDANISGLEREAVNMPIQSSASDLTLWSCVELDYEFREQNLDAAIVIMVHDSIIVECKEEIAQNVAALMKLVMEDPPFDTNVRFPVDIKIGSAWGEGVVYK